MVSSFRDLVNSSAAEGDKRVEWSLELVLLLPLICLLIEALLLLVGGGELLDSLLTRLGLFTFPLLTPKLAPEGPI